LSCLFHWLRINPIPRRDDGNSSATLSPQDRFSNTLILQGNISDIAVGTPAAIPLSATNREEAMTMKLAKKLETIMAAAAFAEEHEHGMALEMLADRPETEPEERRPSGKPQALRPLLAE